MAPIDLVDTLLHRQNDLIDAQNRLVDQQSTIAWAGLLVAGITALILIATAIVTAQMACATDKLALETKRMADDAATQVAITAAEHELAQRPWILPVDFALEDGPEPHIMGIRYVLRNHTDAPALGISSDVHMVQISVNDSHIAPMAELAPGLPIGGRSDLRCRTHISWVSHWREILAGKHIPCTLRLTITVHYKGIGNKRYWTYGCYEYDDKMNDFRFLKYAEGTENEASDDASKQARKSEQSL